MNENADRRIADEHFRRELGERLKALEKSNEFLVVQIKDMQESLQSFKLNALSLHHTLFGGPEVDKVGLIERFRKMATRDRWVIWIVAATIGFAGKLVSPIYDKLVADWAAKQIAVDQTYKRKARIIHYHITYKNDPADEDPHETNP